MKDIVYVETLSNRGSDLLVNEYLKHGWILINVCQFGTPEGMDIAYIVGATKEVYEKGIPV